MPNRARDEKKQDRLVCFLLAGKAGLEAAALKTVLFAVQSYRVLISPLLGSCCRFYPSCSAYAEQALRAKGLWRGTSLAIQRLLKCQPFHPGGVDGIESGT